MNIPIFIPHYGCPNGCVFCNQQKISGKDKLDDESTLREFIEASISTSVGKEDIEIAFFGGSFTGLEHDVQKKFLELATEYVQKYHIKGIRLSTRPDYIHEEIMKFLSDYPVTSIELGVQSLNPEVLKLTKRNHTVDDVEKAVACIKKSQISLGLQMMIGLPGDTLYTALETAKKMISYKPDTIRIYPTLVLLDTELAKMLKDGAYQPLSLEEAVDWTSNLLPLFIEANINVLRVGLQANEGLNSDVVLAGPYHPAFKELVLDELVYNQICNQVEHLICSGDISHLESIREEAYQENEAYQDNEQYQKNEAYQDNEQYQENELYQRNKTYQLDVKIEGDFQTIALTFTPVGVEMITSDKMAQRIIGHKRMNHQRLEHYFSALFHGQQRLIIKRQ